MKKLAGISLFIFFCIVSAILTAGLVFYQNNKNTNNSVNQQNNKNTIVSDLSKKGVVVLDMTEIAKHNVNSDCWMVINNKIYDLSNYASSHPGGTRNITNYCGKESTNAFDTKGGNKGPHSTGANQMLDQFFIGDLNQKIDAKTVQANVQKAKQTPIQNQGGEVEDD